MPDKPKAPAKRPTAAPSQAPVQSGEQTASGAPRTAPKAPPAAPASSARRTVVKPHPTGAAPGKAAPSRPQGPEPIETPNLWSQDSALARTYRGVVEEDLEDPDLQQDDPKAIRKKLVSYVVAVVAVMAIVAAVLLLVVMPAVQAGL